MADGVKRYIEGLDQSDPTTQGLWMVWEEYGNAIATFAYDAFAKGTVDAVAKGIDKYIANYWKKEVHSDWIESSRGWYRQAKDSQAKDMLLAASDVSLQQAVREWVEQIVKLVPYIDQRTGEWVGAGFTASGSFDDGVVEIFSPIISDDLKVLFFPG